MAQKRNLVFALNGVTGAGKTTFASLASGRKHLKIGNGHKSCIDSTALVISLGVPDGAANLQAGTRRPQEVTFRFEGHVVTLIDTPGFQDSKREDEDILEHIAKYLAERYGNGLLLDGLILFHPANARDTTRWGAEKDLTEIVQRILGKNVYDRVAIASTMWDSIPNHAQARAVQQEHRRKQPGGVWHSMCSQAPSSSATTTQSPRRIASSASWPAVPTDPFRFYCKKSWSATTVTWHQRRPARK